MKRVEVELRPLRRIEEHVRLRGNGIVRLDLVPILAAQLPEHDDPVGNGAVEGEPRTQGLDRRPRQRRVLVQYAAEQHLVTGGEDQRLAVGKPRHVHQIVLLGVRQQVFGHHPYGIAVGPVDLAHELQQVQPQRALAGVKVDQVERPGPGAGEQQHGDRRRSRELRLAPRPLGEQPLHRQQQRQRPHVIAQVGDGNDPHRIALRAQGRGEGVPVAVMMA